MPRGLNTEFAIGKVDHQINAANRLSVRYMFFDNFITANVGGGLVVGAARQRLRRSPALDRRAADLDDRRRRCSTSCACSTRRARRAACRTRCRAPARPSTSPASPTSAARSPRVADVRLRLHAERDAGEQQHDAAAAATTRSRPASTCSAWPTRASRPQAQLYTFPNAAAYLAAQRRRPTASATPASRSTSACPNLEYNTSQYGFFVQDDWRVSLGPQGALRRALRPLRRARRRSERADRDLARVPDVEEQLRAARSARCGRSARRRTVGAARQHRPDVRPDAERHLRAGAAERRHQRARLGDVHADPGGRAGVPGRAQRRRRRARRTWRGRSIPTSRSRGRGRTTCSSSAPLGDHYSVGDRRART